MPVSEVKFPLAGSSAVFRLAAANTVSGGSAPRDESGPIKMIRSKTAQRAIPTISNIPCFEGGTPRWGNRPSRAATRSPLQDDGRLESQETARFPARTSIARRNCSGFGLLAESAAGPLNGASAQHTAWLRLSGRDGRAQALVHRPANGQSGLHRRLRRTGP